LGAKQLGVAGDGELLRRSLATTTALAHHKAKALPAHQRYTGVVWEHLDSGTLDAGQRRRIFVPSALLGLVAADDPTPDHRLKFDVTLDGIGRLDRFWRPHLTEAILKRTTAHDTIVELLPIEHRKAIDLDRLAKRRRLVRTEVLGVSGHDAKAVKGATFDGHGWRATYDESASSFSIFTGSISSPGPNPSTRP
jgi:cytoplasmic iron level regulating protein YaaA (DUF328/UPF0246 family)